MLSNKIFSFFIENDLISQNQSGFKPGGPCINQLISITHEIDKSFYQNQSAFKSGDSCINQLLSIAHEIYKSFYNIWEKIGVFLDISKAFDKVLYAGLQLKLKINGISGYLLKIMEELF